MSKKVKLNIYLADCKIKRAHHIQDKISKQ